MGVIIRRHVSFAIQRNWRRTDIGFANYYVRKIHKDQKQYKEAGDLKKANDHRCHDNSNRKSREIIKRRAGPEYRNVMGGLDRDGGR